MAFGCVDIFANLEQHSVPGAKSTRLQPAEGSGVGSIPCVTVFIGPRTLKYTSLPSKRAGLHRAPEIREMPCL